MLSFIILATFATTTQYYVSAQETITAVASVYKAENGAVGGSPIGKLYFTQTGDNLVINGTLDGLPPGTHGFHVHEVGSTDQGCLAAGSHYNPMQVDHGAPTDSIRHVGDLGNIETPQSGPTTIYVTDSMASLTGNFSIIGRAVVIHEKPDDLGRGNTEDSKSTGSAGARIACGVIEKLAFTTGAAGFIKASLLTIITVFFTRLFL